MGEIAELEPDLRRLSRVEYDRLVELGMFAEERVELLYGVVVRMGPHGPDHDATLEHLTELLVPALVGRARVRIQSAFAASSTSEPEPDVAVVAIADHRAAHPSSALLVIEVAGSSLARDRGPKAKLYASSGVPEYWIVNLVDRTIEVYTDPESTGYRNVRVLRSHETVSPMAFPDVAISIATLLG